MPERLDGAVPDDHVAVFADVRVQLSAARQRLAELEHGVRQQRVLRAREQLPAAVYVTTSESIPSGKQPSAAVRSANEPKRNRRGRSETEPAMNTTSSAVLSAAAYYSKYMAFRPGIWYHARERRSGGSWN